MSATEVKYPKKPTKNGTPASRISLESCSFKSSDEFMGMIEETMGPEKIPVP